MERLLSGWKPALITVCKTIQNLGSDQGSLEATAALASLLTHCVLLSKWLDPALGLSVFSWVKVELSKKARLRICKVQILMPTSPATVRIKYHDAGSGHFEKAPWVAGITNITTTTNFTTVLPPLFYCSDDVHVQLKANPNCSINGR